MERRIFGAAEEVLRSCSPRAANRRGILASLAAMLLASFAVQARAGQVTDVNLVLTPAPCLGGFCGAVLNQPVKYRVSGTGLCPLVRIVFGDGNSVDGRNVNFDAGHWEVSHTYRGWPGLKSVTAESFSVCGDKVTRRVRVLMRSLNPVAFRAHLNIGYAPTNDLCAAVPGATVLRENSRVFISKDPSFSTAIGFGCAFSGCVYDANGSSVIANSHYPFPGLRTLSLVLRVGNQIVQGGTSTSFVTNQRGRLELCVNDYKLDDNTGGWGVWISVDESLAPGT
jgi:hypothetical protein